jgi:acetylornithine deacetylase/succinyl-diaminopimelate desuccinylase-like protein
VHRQLSSSDTPQSVLATRNPNVSARAYGRGSYDMKGSAAAVMSAAASLARTNLSGRVFVALVADEEYASIGAQDFLKRHRADACVLTEPSEGTPYSWTQGIRMVGDRNHWPGRTRQQIGLGCQRHCKNGADNFSARKV